MANSNLVFDIGMHLGEDTDYYLHKGLQVVAFEANPDLTETCRIRFHGAINSGQLRIVEGAIAPADKGATLSFYKNPKSVWGTIVADWAERNATLGTPSGIVHVCRVDFHEVLERFGCPHFMKVDVEGVDKHILECLASASDRPQFLSVESDKINFDALVAEIDQLVALGYRFFRAVQQANIPGRRIWASTNDGGKIAYRFQKHSSGPFGWDLRQPWRTRDDVIKDYRTIFRLYRWFGDQSGLRLAPGLGQLVRAAGHFRYFPLPGWYDTHAAIWL